MPISGEVDKNETQVDLVYAINKSLETTSLDSTIKPKKTLHTGMSSASCLTNKAGEVRAEAKRIGKTRVKWDNPKSVMIITKPKDSSLIPKTRELALWLIETPRYGQSSGITVYVDEKLQYSLNFKYKKVLKYYPNAAEKLKFWNPELCATKPELFDFIITLGGDGTVLFTSWLFQTYVPPVIPFHLGSLGFLTPFDFTKYDKYLSRAMENGVRINLRGRLTCTVYRRVPLHDIDANGTDCMAIKLRNIKRNSKTGKITVGGWCKNSNNDHDIKKKNHFNKFGEIDGGMDDIGSLSNKSGFEDDDDDDDDDNKDEDNGFEEHRQVPCFTTVPREQYEVINELVVDRGPSPYVSLLELFGDNKHLTTVQADGLAISTPTGSTAYSLSAGGSLTHPEIHAILITPICPHTLSFRSTLVPDSMELRICVPYNSRNTAWAGFDGRGRVELRQGDHIKVTASKYPFPTVCKDDQTADWFGSVQNCLHWNKRPRQKSFAVVESNSKTRSTSTSSTSSATIIHHSRSGTPNPKDTTIPTRSHSSVTLSSSASSHRTANSPGGISSSSSETGHDEVFGVFSDMDRRSGIGRRYSEADSTTYGSPEDGEDDDKDSDTSGLDTDDEENDDSDDSQQANLEIGGGQFTKGLKGWTDDEISKGRIKGAIAKLGSPEKLYF
ncbi:ATP-NAD kinase-like domain-containing protein [Halteromyces radiatus]|uniref:ATP-NAD kinase-like domain-containing protein n=1 Tax=Halteromyces radiatus TaxID=101107 RepID=UPI0022208BC7|nr:ATP-NAD kinase-like domain-containing protein [Halteromyces radiatus]KAI8089715.1 ATP-NAD kinase-like domain-containing protein [Halteromyces radiatus]